MSSRYVVKTLGCKANYYDSQLIEAELRRRGWAPAAEASDPEVRLCIVNSCTVTDEADRQSRKMASRLARENPEARVVVTGCAAEVDPERIAASRGIHYVVGNRDKPRMVDLILAKLAESAPDATEVLGVAEGYSEIRSRHPIDREWPIPEESLFAPPGQEGASRTRTFLKIQDGCNSFCTYCIIPYGRGPARSLGIDEIVGRVGDLVASGTREVVLTGINLGDYGIDWGGSPQLVELVRAILAKTRLERLRVSSLDPVEIEPSLIELMSSEPRFCPHFHVSLQSPHARILRLMKRKYSAEQVRECLERIAEIPAPPGGAFVGMDVITGFPGETDEEFEWGVERLRELPWSRLHVFPYSERKGTPATRLPASVPQPERVRRAQVLRELSLGRVRSVYERAMTEGNGPLSDILLESAARGPDGTQNWIGGYTANYLRVLLPLRDPREASRYTNQVVAALPREVITDPASGDAAFIADWM